MEIDRDKIAQVIQTFPYKQRLVLNMYYVDGLNPNEISRVVDISHNEVIHLIAEAKLLLFFEVK